MILGAKRKRVEAITSAILDTDEDRLHRKLDQLIRRERLMMHWAVVSVIVFVIMHILIHLF